MSTSTALGSFEIHDASSDIRAVVSSSVTTYGTESTLSSTSILDLLRSPLTWVSQGRDLRLRIRIVCEEHARSDLALAADVYQAAQTAIINAEVCLRPQCSLQILNEIKVVEPVAFETDAGA